MRITNTSQSRGVDNPCADQLRRLEQDHVAPRAQCEPRLPYQHIRIRLGFLGANLAVNIQAGGDRLLDQATTILVRQLDARSEEHTSELQSLMRISYAVFCLKKKNKTQN